ncbi:MAG: hypothetical protein JXQ85_06560 [Cognatishimia sp.]|uniref:DUF7742 family protein n=1 Tax=Cognatishimia sp. TaxID=2211648 RepID=UPI003B8CE3B1
MRMVLAGDVFALAHRIAAMPLCERRSACDQMLQEADWADKYHKRHGQCHPRWGNGSLMGRVGLDGAPLGAPKFNDPDFCDTLLLVITRLQEWRAVKRGDTLGRPQVNRPNREDFTEHSP